mgnify:CR=1 FL=1
MKVSSQAETVVARATYQPMPQPRASATTLATSAPHPPPAPGPQAPQVGLRGRERGGSFEFQALPCCSALPLWLLSESSAGDASGGGGLVRLASPSKRSGEGLMTSTVDAATLAATSKESQEIVAELN